MQQQGYKCPKCNSPITYGAQFCSNCGQRFIWKQQTQPQPPQSPPQEPTLQQLAQTPQSQQQTKTFSQYEFEHSNANWFKRHLNWTLLITVIVTYIPTMMTFAPVESTRLGRSIWGMLIQSINPSISDETLAWFYLPIWLALVLPVAGWVLRQKKEVYGGY